MIMMPRRRRPRDRSRQPHPARAGRAAEGSSCTTPSVGSIPYIRYDGVIRGSTHARLALRRPAATNRHNISGMHATCSLDHMYEPSRSEREPKSSHSARPHWANADVMRSRSGPERAPSGHSPSAEQSSAPVAIWTVLRVGPAGHHWAQVDSHTATSAQQLSII